MNRNKTTLKWRMKKRHTSRWLLFHFNSPISFFYFILFFVCVWIVCFLFIHCHSEESWMLSKRERKPLNREQQFGEHSIQAVRYNSELCINCEKFLTVHVPYISMAETFLRICSKILKENMIFYIFTMFKINLKKHLKFIHLTPPSAVWIHIYIA